MKKFLVAQDNLDIFLSLFNIPFYIKESGLGITSSFDSRNKSHI